MNKEKKNIAILSGLLLLLILIFFHNQEVKESIIFGTELWLTKVFPSLFPMFILSELLIAYQFPEILAKILKTPFQKIFHTTSFGAFAFFMSLLSGTPSSAYILKKLVTENKISSQDASFLLSWTFFSNPLFLITMLSLLFPKKPKFIIGIILIHYLSNLIIGFLLRPKIIPKEIQQKTKKQEPKLGTVLSSAIKNSINTLLLILGTICFYLTISCLFTTPHETINILIQGTLELTQGLNALISSNSLIQKAYLSIFFISFGGLSIHTQIKSILESTNISYSHFLKGRILHVILSWILLFLTTSTGIIS